MHFILTAVVLTFLLLSSPLFHPPFAAESITIRVKTTHNNEGGGEGIGDAVTTGEPHQRPTIAATRFEKPAAEIAQIERWKELRAQLRRWARAKGYPETDTYTVFKDTKSAKFCTASAPVTLNSSMTASKSNRSTEVVDSTFTTVRIMPKLRISTISVLNTTTVASSVSKNEASANNNRTGNEKHSGTVLFADPTPKAKLELGSPVVTERCRWQQQQFPLDSRRPDQIDAKVTMDADDYLPSCAPPRPNELMFLMKMDDASNNSSRMVVNQLHLMATFFQADTLLFAAKENGADRENEWLEKFEKFKFRMGLRKAIAQRSGKDPTTMSTPLSSMTTIEDDTCGCHRLLALTNSKDQFPEKQREAIDESQAMAEPFLQVQMTVHLPRNITDIGEERRRKESVPFDSINKAKDPSLSSSSSISMANMRGSNDNTKNTQKSKDPEEFGGDSENPGALFENGSEPLAFSLIEPTTFLAIPDRWGRNSSLVFVQLSMVQDDHLKVLGCTTLEIPYLMNVR